MSEYIPLEIQEEILKRLPVKPLVQFRSVSKTWKGLIDSPDFIVSYGVRHPHTDCFILRYVEKDKISTFVKKYEYITLVDSDDGHSFVQQDFVPTIPKTLETHYRTLVGSSHGLMCLYNPNVNEMAVLWNHTIRKSVGIQLPRIYDTSNENLANVSVHTVIGFGVCPATLDPTILKIERIYYRRKDMPLINIPWKVGVFTLSTGAWSILSTNLPRESIRLLDDDQITIDGFIYWLAFNRLGGLPNVNYMIVSFDLTTKEFKEINLPVPDSLTNRLCRFETISKLRESLVVLGYHKELEEDLSFSFCSLWMMKEQGVNRSFTKLYNINMPNTKINKILGFRKTGELIVTLIRQLRNAEIQIYDPNSEAIHNLGIGKDGYALFMCSYAETLLLLDQLDGFIYSINN